MKTTILFLQIRRHAVSSVNTWIDGRGDILTLVRGCLGAQNIQMRLMIPLRMDGIELPEAGY